MNPICKIALVAVLVLTALPLSHAAAAFPGGNGKIAFTSERDGTGDDDEVFSMNADGSAQANLTQLGPAKDQQPAFSPNGQRIAFVSNRDADLEIYVMNADGSGQTRLTSSAGADEFPAWSPDGTKIVFESARLGATEVFVMNADGSNQTNLTNNAANDQAPVMSPDGQKIAFHSNRDGPFEIYTMSATGSGQTRLTNSTGLFANWSPDGQKIAFDSVRDGQREIYSMDANGSNQTNLTNNAGFDTDAAWSPDGQKIAFATTRDNGFEVYSMDANGSNQTNLSNDGGADKQPDWGVGVTDGDSLPDTWEEDGVDVDGDGIPDLDLPAMGADPNHKDIFVEVDFMAGHQIPQAQIDAVVAAFKAAPVGNPDGEGGITLHVDNGSGSTMDPGSGAAWGTLSDQDSLTHQDVLGSDFTVGGQPRYDWSEFESIRQTKFLAARRTAFHYAIAAHSGPNQRFSGISRGVTGGAADFVIAMHENCPKPTPPLGTECASPDPEYLASTFMHELGHNLSLQHGGTDEDARKPNYLSVMNYNFGWGLIAFTGATPTSTAYELDYSRYSVPLNESALDEEVGFGIDSGPLTAFKTIFTCPNGTRYRIELTTQHTDWNCDGSFTGIGTVSSDVSGNGTTGSLASPIDWNRLFSSGGGIGALNQPPGAEDTAITEPTPAELQQNRDLLENGSPPPFDAVQPPASSGGSTAPAPAPPAVKKCKKGFKLKKGKCMKKKRRN
jgi:WD40 repeat protein